MDRSRILLCAALASALALCASCLENDTLHDLYLDPDGSVVWTVTEREVRSRAETAEERRREERDYLDAARGDAHAIARGLWRAGARKVSTTVVRDAPPLTVVTRGTFGGLDEALSGLLDGLGLAHEVELVAEEDGTLALEISLDERESAAREPDEALLALADALGSMRIVLTGGTFVEAVGFELEPGGVAARIVEPPLSDGIASYRLLWQRVDP
jgi:hypothetical protein